jgi:hypothetical protein
LELRGVCNFRVIFTVLKAMFFEAVRREKQAEKGSAPSLSQLARLLPGGDYQAVRRA